MSGHLPSVEVCETALREALSDRNWDRVEAALTAIAVQDPHRAQELVDLMRFGLAVSQREQP